MTITNVGMEVGIEITVVILTVSAGIDITDAITMTLQET
jgi:hypothetical protein